MAVHSDTLKLHVGHLKCFLDAILKSGLTLNLKKCVFAKGSIRYVGHILGSRRHGLDPSKVEAVSGLKRPVTKKQVRQLLGLFGYFRSYVPMYSKIAKPLTDLTVKSKPNIVVWGQEPQCAFDNLKHKLSNSPVLFTFEVRKPWFLQTDASGVAVAACVGQ